MSVGSDARGDLSDGSDGSDGGGGGGGGSARRGGSAGRGRSRFPFEGSTCMYPMRRPQQTLLRHSSHLAHAAFSHPRWHFGPDQAAHGALQLADARDLLRAHIGVAEGAPLPGLHFSSNQREFDLPPLGALAAHAVLHTVEEDAPPEEEKQPDAVMATEEEKKEAAEPAAAPADAAADPAAASDLGLLAAKSGFGPDAAHPAVPPADSFAYVGTAVSSMSWCPAGDESQCQTGARLRWRMQRDCLARLELDWVSPLLLLSLLPAVPCVGCCSAFAAGQHPVPRRGAAPTAPM